MLKPATPRFEDETTSERITRQATALSDRLRAVGEIAFPPKAMKA